MDAQKVDMFLMANNHYLPQNKLLPLREQLLSLDDSYWIVLTSIQFKNPTIAVLFSIFFFHFAVDRFYIGDIALGLLKLFTAGGFLFWAFLDLFLIAGATRDRNYQKLQARLQ